MADAAGAADVGSSLVEQTRGQRGQRGGRGNGRSGNAGISRAMAWRSAAVEEGEAAAAEVEGQCGVPRHPSHMWLGPGPGPRLWRCRWRAMAWNHGQRFVLFSRLCMDGLSWGRRASERRRPTCIQDRTRAVHMYAYSRAVKMQGTGALARRAFGNIGRRRQRTPAQGAWAMRAARHTTRASRALQRCDGGARDAAAKTAMVDAKCRYSSIELAAQRHRLQVGAGGGPMGRPNLRSAVLGAVTMAVTMAVAIAVAIAVAVASPSQPHRRRRHGEPKEMKAVVSAAGSSRASRVDRYGRACASVDPSIPGRVISLARQSAPPQAPMRLAPALLVAPSRCTCQTSRLVCGALQYTTTPNHSPSWSRRCALLSSPRRPSSPPSPLSSPLSPLPSPLSAISPRSPSIVQPSPCSVLERAPFACA